RRYRPRGRRPGGGGGHRPGLHPDDVHAHGPPHPRRAPAPRLPTDGGVTPYRHADEAHLTARRQTLLDTRLREAYALVGSDAPSAIVYSTRFARAAFGLAGLGMAAVLVDAAMSAEVPLVPILDASWLVIGAVVLAARPLGLLALREGLRRRVDRLSDDVRDDI